jgi:hypothetical protein
MKVGLRYTTFELAENHHQAPNPRDFQGMLARVGTANHRDVHMDY